ncbi:MAG: hypothetical protein A2Z25_00770 [Planctomycetes bacterium RBG_16_55_9]|nr:MAG: hypothetical protein A2Z25_00770 [Planctomycetes bacterium RBG_16_55_9]
MTKSRLSKYAVVTGFVMLSLAMRCKSQPLWDLANQKKDLLRISTLFDAQSVRDHLSSEEGLGKAVEWCKKTGVTHVFIESFRDNYTAERDALLHAKSRFQAEGFDVSGCVTTTNVGKPSTGWNLISCYTDKKTQERLQQIFEYAASMFDEIMIDDFLFCDCRCDECKAARGDRSWADYHCDLMVSVSRERILGPAQAVNPNVKIIIKYPQWYDDFHNRGYEVSRETADYDRIWVGTETRDYDNQRWGGKVQYEAYYIMRWLGEIGGAKTGGGWFDPFGTTEDTYVEQARQTVLADAKEMLLFCYGALLRGTGPANVEKLRAEIPGLFVLAELVRGKPLKGIMAPKPPNSDAYNEQYVFDFIGMLGLPLAPAATIKADAEAAFFPVHALKDPAFADKLQRMLAANKPVLITDGLAKRLPGLNLENKNLTILKVNGNPRSLLNLTRDELNPIRNKLLAPFGLRFDAPNKVALYLIGEHGLIVENFNDEPIDATLEFTKPVKASKTLILPGEGVVDFSSSGRKLSLKKITPRTLVAIEYE